MLVKHVKGCSMLALLILVCVSSSAQKSIAEQLADKQLEAYNKLDIDAFMDVFSDDVKVYDDLSKYNVSDKAGMRKNYELWFATVDTVKCKIINRIVAGNTIIDYEELTYRKAGEKAKVMKAIAIYRIKGDKIVDATFLRPEF